jgi:hypothetical protein
LHQIGLPVAASTAWRKIPSEGIAKPDYPDALKLLCQARVADYIGA